MQKRCCLIYTKIPSAKNPNIVKAIDLVLENIHPNALKWTNGNMIVNDLLAPLMENPSIMQQSIEKVMELQALKWSWNNLPGNALAVVSAVRSMPKEAREIGGNFICSCITNRLSKFLTLNKTSETKNSITTQHFPQNLKISDFKESDSKQI
jgi:hypothetical protein